MVTIMQKKDNILFSSQQRTPGLQWGWITWDLEARNLTTKTPIRCTTILIMNNKIALIRTKMTTYNT